MVVTGKKKKPSSSDRRQKRTHRTADAFKGKGKEIGTGGLPDFQS